MLSFSLWEEKEKNISKSFEHLFQDGFYSPIPFVKNKMTRSKNKKDSTPHLLNSWLCFEKNESFGLIKAHYHPKTALPYIYLYAYFTQEINPTLLNKSFYGIIKHLFEALPDACFLQILTNRRDALEEKSLDTKTIFRINPHFFDEPTHIEPFIKQTLFTVTTMDIEKFSNEA